MKTIVKDKNNGSTQDTENNTSTTNTNQNTGNGNDGNTSGGNNNEQPSNNDTTPIREADYVPGSYFIDNLGNKWIQGRDYQFSSTNAKDCYDYINNTLGGNGGHSSANLRDGGKIYYVNK
jgi:hypothetical protein